MPWAVGDEVVTALASLIAAQERNGEDHGTRVSLAARL